MNIRLFPLPLVLCCSLATGNSNFVSNPVTPYPPACADTASASQAGWLDARAIKFHETTILLPDRNSGAAVPVEVAAFRSMCAEPGRSLVWLRFSISADLAQQGVELTLPSIWAEWGDSQGSPLLLVSASGSWNSAQQAWMQEQVLASRWTSFTYGGTTIVREWVFLADSVRDWLWDFPSLSTGGYNGRFTLNLQGIQNVIDSIEVPATLELAPTELPRLPLSGRLSGTWVIQGAADQGFQFAVSEQVALAGGTEPSDGGSLPLFFFTQYTFDAQGRPLWLVGNATFEPGATSIRIPVKVLHDGEFRGARKAVRSRAGTVKLTVHSCNDVDFRYDYAALGLGQGVRRLQRPFSLEVAGYDCRDYEARVEADR